MTPRSSPDSSDAMGHVGSPASAGHVPRAPLPTIGRAKRWQTESGAELWRLDGADAALADRIVALGRQGIGAVVAAGRDEEGAWFVRSVAGRATLHQRMGAYGHEPMPWREAVELGIAIADCLAQVEAASLLPGPLLPKQILVDEAGGVSLVAEPLVFSLVGEAGVRMDAGSSALSRWVAPEQAAGAPWDAAGNRYVLGLLLYRMLAGQHPFTGQGLRRRLDAQAVAGAPPMPDEVARTLPPGVQSLVLRVLAAAPVERPRSAKEIGDGLRGFVDVNVDVDVDVNVDVDVDVGVDVGVDVDVAPIAAAATKPSRSRWPARLVGALPIALGLGLAVTLSGLVREPAAAPKTPAADITPTAPLSTVTTRADDCGTCHPEQTAQWHLSVMAHSVKSPLFQGLEILIQEQVAKSDECPDGSGILRRADSRTACRDPQTGIAITGSGGEHWCVNCHSPSDNLATAVPAWDGLSFNSQSRRPLRDLLPPATMDGISCAFCHQVHGPVRPGNERAGRYEGNPDWISTATGLRFSSRPEDRRGRFGIANSGYFLDPAELLASAAGLDRQDDFVPGGAHLRPTQEAKDYLASSDFCGACHDVRLFGTDVLGAQRGEHFKRLRNAYSEWTRWAEDERRAGKEPASCQDCHMSTFPGICAPGDEPAPPSSASALRRACPEGTHFEARDPGQGAPGLAATGSGGVSSLSTHYFSGVDVPLADAFPQRLIDDLTLDAAGVPRGAKQRRDLLLGRTFRFTVDEPRRRGGSLSIPIVIENVGAGHRVPAGFSQEREFWVHLRVTDATGRIVYEVGRVDEPGEDLHDKEFIAVNTNDAFVDNQGRPLGMFGADVIDGPDVPRWDPDPGLGGTEFRGKGLVNLQNGFLRCVTCIGFIDAAGKCQPGPGQGRTRADRFDDGVYDIDTGECESNLFGEDALLETYFPVGALDATRGLLKGPDAIIDRRSAPPDVPLRYTYDLGVGSARGPLKVTARLMFRAFPPFLVKAFADYEARQAARGKRPSGPLVTRDMLDRLEIVELHRVEVEVP